MLKNLTERIRRKPKKYRNFCSARKWQPIISNVTQFTWQKTMNQTENEFPKQFKRALISN